MGIVELLMDGFSKIEVNSERVVAVRISRKDLKILEYKILSKNACPNCSNVKYRLWGAEILVSPIKYPVIIGEKKTMARYINGKWVIKML